MPVFLEPLHFPAMASPTTGAIRAIRNPDVLRGLDTLVYCVAEIVDRYLPRRLTKVHPKRPVAKSA